MKNQFLVKRDLHFLPAQAATLRREKDQKDSEHSKEAIFKFFPGIAHYSSKRVILFFGFQFLERIPLRKVAALRRRLDLKEARHGKPFNPSLLVFLLGIWPGHGHGTLQRAGAASRSHRASQRHGTAQGAPHHACRHALLQRTTPPRQGLSHTTKRRAGVSQNGCFLNGWIAGASDRTASQPSPGPRRPRKPLGKRTNDQTYLEEPTSPADPPEAGGSQQQHICEQCMIFSRCLPK